MKYWILLTLTLILTNTFAYAQSAKSPKYGQIESITVDGLKRKYSLHLPKGKETQANLPLVIVLHGAKGSYKKSEGFTGFDPISDQHGFIIAYPNAIRTQWNDGRLPGDTPSYDVDDVHFLSELIDHLADTYAINRSRVYLVGFSSGGMMAQRFAMEKAEKIAGIAPIASSIPVPQLKKKIYPTVSMPVIMLNGTEDPAFPWQGGKIRFAGIIKVGEVNPIEQSIQYWIDANGGQTGETEVSALPETIADGTQVEKITYQTHKGPNVVLYKIYGGGHSWPGAKYPMNYLPKFMYGRTSQQLNGSETAWEFLKNYSRMPSQTHQE